MPEPKRQPRHASKSGCISTATFWASNRSLIRILTSIDQKPKNLLMNYVNTVRAPEKNALQSQTRWAPSIKLRTISRSINQSKCIQNLKERSISFDLKLHIVIFIRSQLDYINPHHIYSLRRFYNSQIFEEFISDGIEGEMHSGRQQRGRITCHQDFFNSWTYFKPLLKAKKSGLRMSFIPFKQGGSDPIQVLIKTIGVSQNQPCRSFTSWHFNRSPGTRGTWMARLQNQKLKEHKSPINPSTTLHKLFFEKSNSKAGKIQSFGVIPDN